jgi:hypothetical protein
MKRVFSLLLAVSLPLVGCQRDKSSAPAAANDPKFDQEWGELAKGGAEPLFIEGELHGAGLMGELRRAVDSPHDGKLAAVAQAMNGPLPDTEVVRVIRQNLGGVKACYAVEERAGTVGSGKAIVSVEISPTGTVSSVKIDAPAFQQSKLPTCISDRAKGWTFPKFTEGPKRFSYPFVFVGG